MKKDFGDIRTGVIGVGSMGQNHARVLNEISNLVGVFDANEEQGKKVADSLDVQWHNNIDLMLDNVDAVSVVVPTKLHRSISEHVINKGVNLLVEKPLSMSLKEVKILEKF